MRKLRLDPDELHVETFRTDEFSAGWGTVHGHVGPVIGGPGVAEPTCSCDCASKSCPVQTQCNAGACQDCQLNSTSCKVPGQEEPVGPGF